MGLAGDVRRLAREYASNPVGQYRRHLVKVLELSGTVGLSRQEVLSMVLAWSKQEDKKQDGEKNACVKQE